MVGKLFAPIMLLCSDAGGFRRAQYYWQSGSTAGAKSVLGGAFLPRIQNVVFIALGAVVLSITGVEALYADMGHFGKLPICPHGSLWCCLHWY